MKSVKMEVYRGLLNIDPVPISFNQNFSYKPLAKPYHDIYQIKVYTVFYSLEIKTGTNRQPVYNKPSPTISQCCGTSLHGNGEVEAPVSRCVYQAVGKQQV